MKDGLIKRVAEHTRLASVYRAAREEWRFARLGFVETPLGYRFAGRDDMQTGRFEPAEFLLVREHLRRADVFVDIGANVGYFTLLACSMGKHVVAIEPLGENLRYLYANLRVNGWTEGVEVYPVGLSDRPGLAFLHGAGTGASLVSGWSGASPAFKRTIPVTTLDTLLGDRFAERRLVIKMDIEGHEYPALLGAFQTLRAKPRPLWLVEITLTEHRQGHHNRHFMDTFEVFWSLGYKATAVGSGGRKVSEAEIQEYADGGPKPPWAGGNYLFSDEDDSDMNKSSQSRTEGRCSP